MDQELEDAFRPSRLRALLDHFAAIEDPREAPKVRYPLREVLFVVVAATIADCEDYDEIADWGEAHLPFLRRFSEFHFGTPCADWLRVVMNRIDPGLFQQCFTDWATALRPDAPKLIAIDGKTSRRTHDRSRGRRALHMVSAWASRERLVLARGRPWTRRPTNVPPSPRCSTGLTSRARLSPSTVRRKRHRFERRAERLQPDHRRGDHHARRRLPPRRESQPADAAPRDRRLLRRSRRAGGDGGGDRQGPWPARGPPLRPQP